MRARQSCLPKRNQECFWVNRNEVSLQITVCTIFYLAIFGRDEVRGMFLNAFLGLLGVYSQIGWLLSFFGREIRDFPYYVHVIPFLYFVLYTFLLRHAVLDLTQSRENPVRRQRTENGYIVLSVAVYLVSSWVESRR